MNLLWLKAAAKNAMSDAEKKQKKFLERKLAEMEEELKVIKFLGLIPQYLHLILATV